jgi:hypothetical protein
MACAEDSPCRPSCYVAISTVARKVAGLEILFTTLEFKDA